MIFAPSYPDLGGYNRPSQQHVDWLLGCGVPLKALTRPPMVLIAHGFKADDGCFEDDADGEPWLVFPEVADCIFWQPRSGAMASWNNRAFALGEDIVHAAATYSFGGCLNVFADPLDWLRANRDGVVILNWNLTYDRLRDCPRIAIDETLVNKLERHLKPPRVPEIFVLRQQEAAE
ncbi:hypothetical protein [Ensifer aridi]|uniref:hypothetical protein n=1 Tax=Ensifer aridi TaxID=1708715 RepID=UPI000413FF0B|nr:hypothetical protein [Ensifer aridi]